MDIKNQEEVQNAIECICDDISRMLVAKNRDYGNSALDPKRVFSAASPIEQILVRIDDKLSRIATLGVRGLGAEDTIMDLVGYLVLLKVALRAEGPAKAPRPAAKPASVCGGCDHRPCRCPKPAKPTKPGLAKAKPRD